MADTVLWGAALSAINALIYLLVGRAVLRRPVSKESRPAILGFASFWYGLAGVSVGGLAILVAGQFDMLSVAGYLTYLQFVLLVIMIAIAGLLYYLIMVYTGKRGAWKPVLASYLVMYFIWLYVITWANPTAIIDGPWGPELEYERELTDIPAVQILGALLTLPSIIAAVAYGLLLRKAETRSQRFRVGSIASGFIVWFGSGFIASYILDLDTQTAGYRLFSSVLAAAASLVVLMAFAPPKWLQRRLRIESYADVSPDKPPE